MFIDYNYHKLPEELKNQPENFSYDLELYDILSGKLKQYIWVITINWKKYYGWTVKTYWNIIYSIISINCPLEILDVKKIPNLWYNMLKLVLLEYKNQRSKFFWLKKILKFKLNTNKEVIIENCLESAKAFWDKSIKKLEQEWIITWCKKIEDKKDWYAYKKIILYL